MILALIIVLLVNSLGLFLRLNDYDRFFILFGFRFHLSTILPLLIFFKKNSFSDAKEFFLNSKIKFGFLIFILILLAVALVPAVLYLFNLAKISDPDFMYELGFSSIFDFPVYLIWNLPQLIILNLFLFLIAKNLRFQFPVILIFLFLLFAYEIIPADLKNIDYQNLIIYSGIIVFYSVILSISKNIILSASVLFTLIWSNILISGSKIDFLIKIFIAKNYNEWEGFFKLKFDFLNDYSILIQSFILLISFLTALLLNSKNKQPE